MTTNTNTITLLFSLLTLLSPLAQTATTPNCDAPDQGSTLRITHINSPCSPHTPNPPLSWQDTVLQMQSNDQTRLQYLSTLVAGRSIAPIASGRSITQNPTYIVKLKIGTPPQTLLAAVDTSNDAAWIPCAGCLGCKSSTFNPAKSSTFRPIPCRGNTCRFNRTYGSSVVAGRLVRDNITLAADSIPRYTFGCLEKTTGSSFPAQGLFGLGRGPLSLMSQTPALYRSTFSYCLPSYKSPNFSGSLRLGPNSQPIKIKKTELLKNPKRPSLYYANLVGIRVGKRVLNIPSPAFKFDPNTGAGTIFDSGTVFTTLVKPAYLAVRNEVRRRMGKARFSSLGGFDTCYVNVPVEVLAKNVPTINFMFSGMNMSLPQDNFIIRSTAGNIACLAMAARADGNPDSVVNVIASFQQQNHRILIDGAKSKLGVAREQCS